MGRVTTGVIVAVLAVFAQARFLGAADGDGAKATVSTAIAWNTDEPSKSSLEYGTDQMVGSKLSDRRLSTRHRFVLADLNPGTRYYYRIISADASGNVSVSPVRDFVAGAARDTLPPAIMDIEAQSIVAAGTGEGGEAEKMVKTEAPIERTLIQKGGLLMRKGGVQMEPAFTYAHVSANRITVNGTTILPVLVIGQISTQQVKRDIFIGALTTRYGLMDNLQVDLRVPYRYQHDRVTNVDLSTESTRSASGIGDVEGTLLTQLLYENGSVPDLLAGVNIKSRTGKAPYNRDIGLGTGHWAVKGILTAVKTADPAVIFGGINYAWTMRRDVGGYGKVDPGDVIGYNLGLAFALNYQLGLNFQLEHLLTQKMTIDGSSVPGSFTNVANFRTGVNWSISKNLSSDVSMAIGLTEDSPDFTIEVKFPYTF